MFRLILLKSTANAGNEPTSRINAAASQDNFFTPDLLEECSADWCSPPTPLEWIEVRKASKNLEKATVVAHRAYHAINRSNSPRNDKIRVVIFCRGLPSCG